jgi:cbb3-type cytochrome oxidase subunit 3
MFYPHYGFSFLAAIIGIVGVIALLTNLGVLDTGIWNWWPILLILLAVYIFALKKKKKKIYAGHILGKIINDERIQEKVKKIIDTADEVINKKLDEWHEEATEEKKARRK